MWQLLASAGWLGSEGKGRALGVGEVKFTGQVLPAAKKVTYRIRFKRINRRLIMGTADGEVLVDGRLIYTANDLKVGLFRGYICFLNAAIRGFRKAKPPHCGGFCFKDVIRLCALSPMASRQPPSHVTFD